MNRRTFLATAAVASAEIPRGSARGQSLQREKDLRIFIGFEAGGGADSVARAIAPELQRRTSQRVVIENRTGAFGAMPVEIVKRAGPDGAELALLSSTTLISRLATTKPAFDPVKDLAPITRVGDFPIAFAVSPTLGIDSFKGYLDWINQGDASRRRIGVSSNTTFVEVLNVLLRRSIGLSLEPVYYRGTVPILGDLRDGRLPATVNTLTSLLPPHRGRRARILMTTATRRLSSAPGIPTAVELGYPTLDMMEWFAFFASPVTPPTLVDQLNRRLRNVIDDREVVESLKPLGLDVETSTPEALAALVDAHRLAWLARLEATGIKAATAR